MSFLSSVARVKGILELIHSDMFVLIPIPLLGGYRYYVSFIDDFSRMVCLYLLKQKSNVFKNFKDFKSYIENQMGMKINLLRTENGEEFCGKEFN